MLFFVGVIFGCWHYGTDWRSLRTGCCGDARTWKRERKRSKM